MRALVVLAAAVLAAPAWASAQGLGPDKDRDLRAAVVIGASAKPAARLKVSSNSPDTLALLAQPAPEMVRRGQWFLFASASGKSMGLDSQGSPWLGPRDDLVGDSQAGLGWSRGPMLASVGYVHRTFKLTYAPPGVEGSHSDSLAALTVSFRPHR